LSHLQHLHFYPRELIVLLTRRTKYLVGILNHEAVLAALPNSKDDAKSLKDIAQAIGLATSTHMDWIRAERNLAGIFRILIKLG
jgi:hypothetical protein